MRRFILLVVLAGLALALLAVPADSNPWRQPKQMSYQGVLTDPNNVPLPAGNYQVVFKLYDASVAGNLLWQETQTLAVSHGIFEAVLGSVNALQLDFSQPYWLGVSVSGNPELVPRTALTSSPYAMGAIYADSARISGTSVGGIGGSGTSHYIPAFTGPTTLGNSALCDVGGYLGVGLTAPTAKLTILDPEPLIRLQTSNSGTEWNDGLQIGVSTAGSLDYAIWNREEGALRLGTSDEERVRITSDGRVGVGTAAPTVALDVNGTVKMTGFQLSTGPVNNFVLTSDAAGVGTWRAAAAGDVTAVYADEGLTGGGVSGDTHLAVGAGDGIDVVADAVLVDVTDIAGNGLGEDASNNLVVNVGTGLEIVGDAVGLTAAYRDGTAYDARFVNEGQASSVTSAMIVDGTVAAADLANNIDASAKGFNADMVDGVHAVSLPQLRLNSSLAAGSTVTISIPHYSSFNLQLSGGWPYQGGLCNILGFENDWMVGVTYTKYNGDGTSGYGGAEGAENSNTTLVSFGSGGQIYTVTCPNEAGGDHNLVLSAAGSTVELKYKLIW